eukprot:gene1680-1042_t
MKKKSSLPILLPVEAERTSRSSSSSSPLNPPSLPHLPMSGFFLCRDVSSHTNCCVPYTAVRYLYLMEREQHRRTCDDGSPTHVLLQPNQLTNKVSNGTVPFSMGWSSCRTYRRPTYPPIASPRRGHETDREENQRKRKKDTGVHRIHYMTYYSRIFFTLLFSLYLPIFIPFGLIALSTRRYHLPMTAVPDAAVHVSDPYAAAGEARRLTPAPESSREETEADRAVTASTAASSSSAKGVLGVIAERCRAAANNALVFALSLVSVACWGLAGNACRISLSNSFREHNFFVGYTYFGPNALGSFAIGLFQASLPSEPDMPWLQRGLCAGFCGSLTTLSSWMLDVANGKTLGAAAEELLCGVTIPMVYYVWGLDCGAVAATAAGAALGGGSESHPRLVRLVDTGLLVLVACAAVAAPSALYAVQHNHRPPVETVGTMSSEDLRDTLLAPCGAVPRFVLGYLLNKHEPWRNFPVGTFLCNTAAVLLATLLNRRLYTGDAPAGYGAVLTGVCGALSTVSTFVSETVLLHRSGALGMAYCYLLATVGIALFIAGMGRQENFR